LQLPPEGQFHLPATGGAITPTGWPRRGGRKGAPYTTLGFGPNLLALASRGATTSAQ
jgi:hypothetical protein